jgi:alkaline phosphatase
MLALVLAYSSGCASSHGVSGLSRAAPMTDRELALHQAIVPGKASRVILLIGDGLSDPEITMARNYEVGAAGRLALDTLPLVGAYTTYAVQEEDPRLPDYVVDSAASATAWATGHKTSNRRLSTGPHTGAPLATILEIAQANGFATGNVTTAALTDATPAALAAHVNDRACQGPADMAACPQLTKGAGGPGSIAEQMVEHRIEVLLGGGRRRLEQTIPSGPQAGLTVVELAGALGYAVVTELAGLQAIQPGHLVLGLFAAENFAPAWAGEPALAYPGSGPQRCREAPLPPGQPSLEEMTRSALALLDGAVASGKRGFFLQVEGAGIDKMAHAANPCGEIGEIVAFDAAVRVALEYAARQPDTLVIVTGDHAHSAQIVPPPSPSGHSPGVFSTLVTNEGVPMTISYATNAEPRYQQHTGAQVRIAAQGPHAAHVTGTTDQTDLFRTLCGAMGLPCHSE